MSKPKLDWEKIKQQHRKWELDFMLAHHMEPLPRDVFENIQKLVEKELETQEYPEWGVKKA